VGSLNQPPSRSPRPLPCPPPISPSPVAAWPPSARPSHPGSPHVQRGGERPHFARHDAWRSGGAPPPLPPFRARPSRPLPLRGMRKGGSSEERGAARERYAPSPLPSPSPVAALSARPRPPVRHACSEGAPALHTRRSGGALPPPFRSHTLPLRGMQKGRGVSS
jgi:hypothetical protein